jgi:exopolysaccharide production protein ExoY
MSTNPMLVPGLPRPARSRSTISSPSGGSADAPSAVWNRSVTHPSPVEWRLRGQATAPPLSVVALGVTDLVGAGLALVLAHLIVLAADPGAQLLPYRMPLLDSATLFFVVGTTLAVLARVYQLYGGAGPQSAIEETYVIAKVIAIATGIGAASTFLHRDSQLSVPLLVCFWALSSSSIAVTHALYRNVVAGLYGRDPRPALKLSLVEPSTPLLTHPAGRAIVIGRHLAVLSVAEPAHRDWPYECWFQMKRDLDFVLAAVLLLLTAPLMLTIAVAIRCTSKGPAIFRQTRIGRNARPFGILKFRTMRGDAEAVLAANPALYAEYVANDYKLSPDRDPRITPLGRWLRRTSLDELPQLFNVLRGEMSLVGPRPIVTDEIAHYGDRADVFHAALPGLTGAWQVAGRSELRYPERCEVELEYVRNWSLARDLVILFATARHVISGRGAM